MRYLDPKADLTFKKVFGEHKDLLISLLNALLPSLMRACSTRSSLTLQQRKADSHRRYSNRLTSIADSSIISSRHASLCSLTALSMTIRFRLNRSSNFKAMLSERLLRRDHASSWDDVPTIYCATNLIQLACLLLQTNSNA